jgi:hypothetical protein
VNSKLTDDFLANFARLPDAVKAQARKAYRLWRQNPAHPSLHFKRIHTKESLYSVRVAKGWRALGLIQDATIYWFWIGSHAEYDKLIQQM